MIPADNKSLGCSQNPLNTLHTSCILYCSVPENIHTHPMEGQIMGLNWNFPEGWGDLNQKNPLWRARIFYFLEQQHISYKVTWY